MCNHAHRGSFGKVYEAFNRQTHERVAVKVMDRCISLPLHSVGSLRHRKRIKATSIERELNVLKHLGNHEHVVEFICAYETDEETQFVLEMYDFNLVSPEDLDPHIWLISQNGWRGAV